jgi:hypothetical protein
VSPLVSEDGFEGEVIQVGIPIKGLGVNDEEVARRARADSVLRPARLAVDVAVLDAPLEPEAPSDRDRAPLAGAMLGSG